MSSMNFGMWTFEIALRAWVRKDEALWRKGERNSVVEATGSSMNVGSVGAKSGWMEGRDCQRGSYHIQTQRVSSDECTSPDYTRGGGEKRASRKGTLNAEASQSQPEAALGS